MYEQPLADEHSLLDSDWYRLRIEYTLRHIDVLLVLDTDCLADAFRDSVELFKQYSHVELINNGLINSNGERCLNADSDLEQDADACLHTLHVGIAI